MIRLVKKSICLLVLLLAACSVQASQPGSVSRTSPAEIAPTSEVVPDSPPDQPAGGETQPPAGALPAQTTAGAAAAASQRVLLIRYSPAGRQLVSYDLETGETRTLFSAPEQSWLVEAVLSPDGSQIILSYSPPPEGDELQFGFTDLYRMPADGSAEPQPFLQRTDDQEAFFHPAWSPDGSAVYYSHFFSPDPEVENPEYLYTVEKADLNGETEIVLENAFWPAISPDGSRLAYLTANPGQLTNYLYIAGIDGSQPEAVFVQPEDLPVDEHFFTPDGRRLVFSMVNPATTPASSFWDRLFGVQIARAHDVPSDWYQVTFGENEARRLTELNETGLLGALSPDGRRLVFIASSGLYSLALDGGLPEMISDNQFIGSVDWIP